MRRSTYFASLAALLAGTAVAGPQVPPAVAPRAACCADAPDHAWPTPAASPDPAGKTDADAAAIDALLATLYSTVSGSAGTVRDWAPLARLHAPGARLHLTRAQADGSLAVDSLDFDAFVALHEARTAGRGFHEREIAREVAGFGGVRHVWSTFEARRHPDDPVPYARGINSLQLVRTADGWRLLSATWDFERADLRLPARIAAVTGAGR